MGFVGRSADMRLRIVAWDGDRCKTDFAVVT